MLRSDSASAHPKSVVDHHSAVLRSIVGHVHRSKIRSGFSLQRSNSEVAHPKSGVELYSAALRSGCSTAIDSQERMMRFTNTGSQGPKLRRDSEAVLRSSSPLRRDVLRTTATGVHRSKIRSGLSLRATLLSAVFAFFVAVASGDSAVPSNACRTIKNAGYKIGFYLNGQAFSPTFNGAEIDLLQHYNTWALETRPTTFEPTTARLLLGYDGSSFALPYNAGEVIDLGDGLFHFDSHPNQTVRLDRWIHSEDGFNFTGEAAGFDFGPADPATVTLFHDIMFAGEKKFDVATRVEVANIDYRITYKERNHFDLTYWVSVNSSEDLETLIGVVDGKKVLRKECYLQKDTVVKTDCDAKVCNEAEIQRDVGSFCFSIAGCSIATGPQGLFDTVVVIPKDSIAKPTLPATSTAPTTTSTSTARYWKIPHRKPTPPATTLTSWMDFFNTLPFALCTSGCVYLIGIVYCIREVQGHIRRTKERQRLRKLRREERRRRDQEELERELREQEEEDRREEEEDEKEMEETERQLQLWEAYCLEQYGNDEKKRLAAQEERRKLMTVEERERDREIEDILLEIRKLKEKEEREEREKKAAEEATQPSDEATQPSEDATQPSTKKETVAK